MPGIGKIKNLTLWWDAADPSTINDGKVVPNQNVYKIVDKVSGVTLTNGSGVLGPTYAIGAVNGYNAIHMPYYAGTLMGQKALSNGNVPQFSSVEKTMAFIFKPTTISAGYKWSLAVWGTGRSTNGTWPHIHVYNSSNINAYPNYGEAPTPTQQSLYSLNAKSYEFSVKNNQPIDLNTTQILVLRTKNGISKFNWIHGNGIDSRNEFYNYTVHTGTPVIPSSAPVKLVVGSLYDTGQKGGSVPFEGYFCEMILINRYLNTGEVNSLEQYLKMKWIG